jgi:serine/threonine protein kinase
MIRVAPRVGDVLRERYELTGLLGEGSFGQVFRARQIGLESEVAVKVLQPQLVSNEEVLSRFEREVSVVRELHHPNTIRVLDYGRTDDGIPFFVMEFLRGDPLDEVLARGPLSLGRARRVVLQLLKSLSEAHDRGIVHRDLKPANLMLCQIVGEQDFVKVLDFGIAKAVAKREGENMTQTGAFLGTPSYTCPEQVLGWRDVDHRADIYATGLILAECLIGRPLVIGHSAFEIVAKHAAPEPLELPDAVKSSPFGPIILKATAKDREQRYADAVEMIEALVAISGVSEDRVFEVVNTGSHRPWSSSQQGLHSLPTTPIPGTFDSARASAPTRASADSLFPAPSQGRGKVLLLAAVGGLALVGALVAALLVAGDGDTDAAANPDGATGNLGATGLPESGPPPGPAGTPGPADRVAAANPGDSAAPSIEDPAEPALGPDAEAVAQAALGAEAVQSAARLIGDSLPARRTIRFAGSEGATVRAGDRALGTVPFELVVPALDTTVELSAALRGFRDETLAISLLRDEEVSLALRPVRDQRPRTPSSDPSRESGEPAEPTEPPRRNPLFEEAPIFDP